MEQLDNSYYYHSTANIGKLILLKIIIMYCLSSKL